MNDSGIEWLGQIPNDWALSRVKNFLRVHKKPVGDAHAEFALLSLTKKGIIKRDMVNPQGKFPAEFDTYQEVQPGDFIFCLFDVEETPRTVGLSSFHGMITGAYTVMKLYTSSFYSKYVYYFFESVDDRKGFCSLYTGMRNTLPKNIFGGITIPSPPIAEQQAIADFLDRETALIDKRLALIEKKRALLAELKKSVIQKAVTKGLEKGRTMKDSGVDWVGQTPKEWTVGRLKDVAAIGAGNPAPQPENLCDDIEALAFLRVSDLARANDGICMTTKSHILDPKNHGLKIWKKGTIVFPKSGESIRSNARAFLGKDMAVVSHLACMVVKKSAAHAFVFWVSKLADFESRINQTSLPALGLDVIAEYEIVIPHIAEQYKISQFLEEKVGKIDAILSALNRQEELLKEQRKALIHEVVTGKRRVI